MTPETPDARPGFVSAILRGREYRRTGVIKSIANAGEQSETGALGSGLTPLRGGGSLAANHDGLAAGGLDGLLRTLRELVRVDRNCGLELAVRQDLHQAVALL